MDNFIYTGAGGKTRKSKSVFWDMETSLSLKDLQKNNWKVAGKEQVIKAFCNDLKAVLENDDIHQMIRGVFSVEHDLSVVNDELNFSDDESDVPSLVEFYRNLSPILLRAFLDSPFNEKNPDDMAHGWKEALRIAIEEEFYFWHDRLASIK